MTREEAIIELNKKITCTIGGLSKEEYNATVMAIEALTEPSKVDFRTDESANIGTEVNDLISRADVHKTLSLLATEGGADAKMLLMDAHEFIDALPSADITETEVCQRCQESVERVLLNKATAETTGDLISRAEAIEEWDKLSKRGRTEFDQVLMTLPSADRPQGEWTSECACSLCGCQPWYEGDIHTYNYCPNCGARMRGAE